MKPAISSLLKTILEKNDEDVKGMPLRNNTVSKRVDDMAKDLMKR
jgi:hypothetical protein